MSNCPNTGLPTGVCECHYWDPDNKNARWPDADEFARYCEWAKSLPPDHHRRQGHMFPPEDREE